MGITQVALSGESFLAAASFREPKQVLRSAALCGRKDTLSGITENVLVGGLIPVGSGYEAELESVEARAVIMKEGGLKKRTIAATKLCITFLDPKAANPANAEELDLELEKLVTNLDGGSEDKKVWDRVVELAWARLFEAICCVKGIDEHVARRLTSRVFKGVIGAKKPFACAESFWAFLWNRRDWVVKNYLVRELKRRKRERSHLRKLIERDEQQVEREQEAEVARRLLATIREEAKLTEYQQDVFDLAWGERLSDADIARQLKKSSGAIRRMKTYIKRKLRDTPTVKELREA